MADSKWLSWRLVRRLLPWLILIAAVSLVGFPLLKEAPLTHDHPTHLFKSWHMATKLLPSFRIRGFSHYWVFGFPSDELVPPSELWVVLFRALTFGKLSWLQTYGVSMFGLLLLCAASVYCFTRYYFGTVAGVVAGTLMVWDPGGWAQGGWDWCITFGVWPVTLGACCILLALVSLEKLADRGTAKQFAFAGAWVGASFIAHQVTILFMPVMVALMLGDRWLRRAVSRERAVLMVLCCAFGVALSAFYLLPMLARSEQTLDLGVAGTSAEDVALRLLDLKLFAGGFPAFVVLGFVGAVVGLRRRAPGAFFLAAGTGLFVFLSTDLVISALHAERIMPNLRKVEAQRMLYGAKLLWFPLVAYALAVPFDGMRDLARRFERRPFVALRAVASRWTLGLLACGALLLPYAEAAFSQFKATQIDKTVPGQEVEFWHDLQLVWAHTAPLRAESREHYRIAYDLPMHDHLSTISPVFDDTLMYKVGYTPTQLFVGFPMYADARLFKQLSVKYVVSDHALPAPLYALERRFGRLYFYRFTEFDERPFTVIGAGEAELLELSPERVRVRMSGTAAGSRLKLHVSYVDHWRATENGQRLRIVPATVFDAHDPILMEVPVSDGEVVFEYARRASDWLGLFLTIAAVPAFLLVLRLRRRGLPALRLPELPRAGRLAAWALAAAGVVAVVAVLTVRYRTRSALVSKDSLFFGLKEGELTVEGDPCVSDGPFRWLCGTRYPLKAERVSGLYGTHICLSTTGNSLALRTKRTVGEFLLGRYDVRGGSGSISAFLDDDELGSVGTRPTSLGLQFLQFDTRAHARREGVFRIEMRGAPLHCFDFSVPL